MYDMVVLVEDHNLVPRPLLVESLDRGDCDAEVNNTKQLSCLLAEKFVRFDNYNPLSLGAVVLSNQTLDPSLARACWRHNDCELLVIRHSYSCDCSLEFTVAVFLHLVAYLPRKCVHVCKLNFDH